MRAPGSRGIRAGYAKCDLDWLPCRDAGDDGNGDSDPDSGVPDDSSIPTGDGGTNGGDDDGGTNGDDDGGTNGGACEDARVIELEMGEQTITGDTTGMSSERTLTELCTGEESSPQELLAFVVPGTGEKTVIFDLAVEGTDPDFDTMVEVRPAGCDSAATAACFDDVLYPEEARSAGHFVAQGGSTVHLIVTGYSWSDEPVAEGPWTMRVEVLESDQAPTLTEASAIRATDEEFDESWYWIVADGADEQGDVIGVFLRFFDEGGEEIEIHDYFRDWPFDDDLQGEQTFEGAMASVDIWFIEETLDAAEVEVSLYDRYRFQSAPLRVPISDIRFVEDGEMCDDGEAFCASGEECGNDGLCPPSTSP